MRDRALNPGKFKDKGTGKRSRVAAARSLARAGKELQSAVDVDSQQIADDKRRAAAQEALRAAKQIKEQIAANKYKRSQAARDRSAAARHLTPTVNVSQEDIDAQRMALQPTERPEIRNKKPTRAAYDRARAQRQEIEPREESPEFDFKTEVSRRSLSRLPEDVPADPVQHRSLSRLEEDLPAPKRQRSLSRLEEDLPENYPVVTETAQMPPKPRDPRSPSVNRQFVIPTDTPLPKDQPKQKKRSFSKVVEESLAVGDVHAVLDDPVVKEKIVDYEALDASAKRSPKRKKKFDIVDAIRENAPALERERTRPRSPSPSPIPDELRWSPKPARKREEDEPRAESPKRRKANRVPLPVVTETTDLSPVAPVQQTPVRAQIPAGETLDSHVEKVIDKDRLNIDTPHVPILDQLEQTAQGTETIAKEPDEMQNDPASGTVAPPSTGEDLTPVDKNLQVLANSLPQDVTQADPLGPLDDFAAGIKDVGPIRQQLGGFGPDGGIGALEDIYKVPELPPKPIQAAGDVTALLQHQTAEQKQAANVDATLFGQRQETADPVSLPKGLQIDRVAQEAERRARLGRSAVNIADPGTISPLGKKARQAEAARQQRLAQSPQNVANPGVIKPLPSKDLQREAARLQRLGDAPVNVANPGTMKPLSQKDLRKEIERNKRLGIGLPTLFRKKKGKPKLDIREIAKAAAKRKITAPGTEGHRFAQQQQRFLSEAPPLPQSRGTSPTGRKQGDRGTTKNPAGIVDRALRPVGDEKRQDKDDTTQRNIDPFTRPPVRNRSPGGRNRSPTGSRPPSLGTNKKPNKSRGPLGKTPQPPGKSKSPSRRNRSPSGRKRSPLGRQPAPPFTPSKSPLRRNRSPTGKKSKSPLRRNRSPTGRKSKSPLRKNRSPTDRKSKSPSRRNRSPSGRRRSPSPFGERKIDDPDDDPSSPDDDGSGPDDRSRRSVRFRLGRNINRGGGGGQSRGGRGGRGGRGRGGRGGRGGNARGGRGGNARGGGGGRAQGGGGGRGGGANVNLRVGGGGGMGGGGASASASASGASGAGGAAQRAAILAALVKKPKKKTKSGITAAKKRYNDKRKVKMAELRALKSKRIREHKAQTKKLKGPERTKARNEFKQKVDQQYKEVTKRFPTARGLKDLQTVRSLIDKIDRVRLPS